MLTLVEGWSLDVRHGMSLNVFDVEDLPHVCQLDESLTAMHFSRWRIAEAPPCRKAESWRRRGDPRGTGCQFLPGR